MADLDPRLGRLDLPALAGDASEVLLDPGARLARLGGYLDRTRDSPPGNMVLWRGMARLTDIHLGFTLAKDVGN